MFKRNLHALTQTRLTPPPAFLHCYGQVDFLQKMEAETDKGNKDKNLRTVAEMKGKMDSITRAKPLLAKLQVSLAQLRRCLPLFALRALPFLRCLTTSAFFSLLPPLSPLSPGCHRP
jgi:hypothetical protein